MTTIEAQRQVITPLTTVQEEKQMAEAAAIALEMLANRLANNDGFAEELAAHPKSALGAAGIVLQREGLECLMRHDSARFDKLTDLLFDRINPDFLHSWALPSCEGISIDR